MQVEPIQFMLTAPGTERLKLKYDIVLSNFAFNFNLRRYVTVKSATMASVFTYMSAEVDDGEPSVTAVVKMDAPYPCGRG